MIRIFVHSCDEAGASMVADHFEFEAVPRVGEEIGLDQDGTQYHLRVVGVTHHAQTKSGFMPQVSNIHLSCKLVK